jgi:hypothetical protein
MSLFHDVITNDDVILRRAKPFEGPYDAHPSPPRAAENTPAACTIVVPTHITKAFRPRTVPHAGFAVVQDDISPKAIPC